MFFLGNYLSRQHQLRTGAEVAFLFQAYKHQSDKLLSFNIFIYSELKYQNCYWYNPYLSCFFVLISFTVLIFFISLFIFLASISRKLPVSFKDEDSL